MDDIGYGVSLISPSEARGVVIDGRLIPRLGVVGEGGLTLILDGRFACAGTADEIAKWARMVAEALAIGAGYPFLGAEAPVRPFAPELRVLLEGALR